MTKSKDFFNIKDFYKDDEVEITENGYENIMSLCNIVLNTHYNYVSMGDREDLVSVGVVKVLELLYNTKFDKRKSSLKNYLYTGIRNEMKNYLYRNSKEVLVEDDILYGINESEASSEELLGSSFIIDIKDIVETLESINKNEEPFIQKVLCSLSYMGFKIYEFRGPKLLYLETEKAVALIVWKHVESLS